MFYGSLAMNANIEMSEELTTYFDDPHVMHHGGGHYVPATSKEREGYTSFLTLPQFDN